MTRIDPGLHVMEKARSVKLSEYNFLVFAITVFKFQMHSLRMKAFFQHQDCQTPVAPNQRLKFCIQNDTLLLWERHTDISPWRKRSWKCCLSLRNVWVKWNVVVFAKPWWQILATGYVYTPLFIPTLEQLIQVVITQLSSRLMLELFMSRHFN